MDLVLLGDFVYGMDPMGWKSPLNQYHLGEANLRKSGAADNVDEGQTMDSWVDQMILISFLDDEDWRNFEGLSQLSQ